MRFPAAVEKRAWKVINETPAVDRDKLKELCARYQVRELLLFGSAVHGALRPDSDVDLLVAFEDDARVSLFTLFDLQAELTLLFGRRVDLVPKDGLKAAIRPTVLSEARVLYAA